MKASKSMVSFYSAAAAISLRHLAGEQLLFGNDRFFVPQNPEQHSFLKTMSRASATRVKHERGHVLLSKKRPKNGFSLKLSTGRYLSVYDIGSSFTFKGEGFQTTLGKYNGAGMFTSSSVVPYHYRDMKGVVFDTETGNEKIYIFEIPGSKNLNELELFQTVKEVMPCLDAAQPAKYKEVIWPILNGERSLSHNWLKGLSLVDANGEEIVEISEATGISWLNLTGSEEKRKPRKHGSLKLKRDLVYWKVEGNSELPSLVSTCPRDIWDKNK